MNAKIYMNGLIQKVLLLSVLFVGTLFADTINFKQGWNFVGFKNNITISQDSYLNSSDVFIVWTYTNDNSGVHWNGFSQNSDIATKLSDQSYNIIETIPAQQGVWVYSNVDHNYSQSDSNITAPVIPGEYGYAGWNLLSSPSGTAINVSTLANAQKIFVYRNGQWAAHFNDGTTNTHATLTTVGLTEAYWAYYTTTSDTNTTTPSEAPPATMTVNITLDSNETDLGKLYLTSESRSTSLDLLPPSIPYFTTVTAPTTTTQMTIDSNGTAVITDLPSGKYTLIYINEALGEGRMLNNINVKSGIDVTYEIEQKDLKPFGSLKAEVISALSEAKLSGVKVRVNEINATSYTDSNGSASYNILPVGQYTVSFSLDGYVSQTKTFTISSGTVVQIDTVELTSASGKLSGKVTAEGVEDYSNILVTVKSVDGTIYTALTNALGYYLFDALPVGDGYSVVATAHDYQLEKIDNISIIKDTTTTVSDIYLKLYPTTQESNITVGTISGYARYADINTTLNHAGIIVSIEGTDYEAITSRDGSYILNSIAEGNYTLNFTDSNHLTETIVNTPILAATDNLQQDITLLPKTGNIIGKVVDESNASVESVFMTILTPSQTLTAVTNSDGIFTINGILAGEREVLAAKGGYGVGSRYTLIQENQTTDITSTPIVVTRKLLTGQINLPNTDDNSGITVALIGSDIPLAVTDSDGFFILYGVGVGNYQLQISKTGYTTQTIPLSVIEDNGYELSYTIHLEKNKGIISGQAYLENNDNHPGIKIELIGTGYYTETDAAGVWTLNVPTGNYNNGIKYSKYGFYDVIDATTISVLENSTYSPEESVLYGNMVPEIVSFEGNVNEDASINTTIGKINVINEGSTKIFSYKLTGDDANYFKINSDGNIIVLNDSLDYETKNSYTFQIQAINSIGESEKVTSIININDVPEGISDLVINSAVFDKNNNTLTVYFNRNIDVSTLDSNQSDNYSVEWDKQFLENASTISYDDIFHIHTIQLKNNTTNDSTLNMYINHNQIKDTDGNIPRDYNRTAIEYSIPLIKTGQTIPINDFDDGFYQSGFDANLTHDSAIDVVYDYDNKLIWQDNSDVFDYNKRVFWYSGHDYCENLTIGSYTNWRYPTIDELENIVDWSSGKYLSIFNYDSPPYKHDTGTWSDTLGIKDNSYVFRLNHPQTNYDSSYEDTVTSSKNLKQDLILDGQLKENKYNIRCVKDMK